MIQRVPSLVLPRASESSIGWKAEFVIPHPIKQADGHLCRAVVLVEGGACLWLKPCSGQDEYCSPAPPILPCSLSRISNCRVTQSTKRRLSTLLSTLEIRLFGSRAFGVACKKSSAERAFGLELSERPGSWSALSRVACSLSFPRPARLFCWPPMWLDQIGKSVRPTDVWVRVARAKGRCRWVCVGG